jgi:outer membrane protein assembly factor BamB
LQHSSYNPSETTIGTANAGSLHLLWSLDLGEKIDATPVLATNVATSNGTRNVLYVGAENGAFYAIDADHKTIIWSRQLGSNSYPSCGDLGGSPFGITGSAAFDRSTGRVYVADGQDQVYALNMRDGSTVSGWPVSLRAIVSQNHAYSGLVFNSSNRMLYASTASICDISPWQGRIVAINTANATLVNSFFPAATAYGGTGSGGGIWGPAAASIDPATSDVFIVTGNGDGGSSESSGYNEHIVRLDASLTTVRASNYPLLQGNDVDFGALAIIFTTPGCAPMVVAKNKSGILAQWERDAINSGPTQRVIMAPVVSNGDFIGAPAFSPVTNYIYVSDWANGPNGKYVDGMNALSMAGNCNLQFQWGTPVNTGSSADNQPTSSPVIGNGVVYFGAGLGNAVDAFNAQTGALLWSSGSAIGGPVFNAPLIDGHLYVGSWDHKLYAFGV